MLCKICKDVFSSQKTFLRHCRDEHKGEDGVTRFTCTFDDVCERQFSNTDSFRHHLRDHKATQPASFLDPPVVYQQPPTLCQPTDPYQQPPGPSISFDEVSDEEDVVENFYEPSPDIPDTHIM